MIRHDFPIASLELPEGWEDRSSYQFVSVAQPGLSVVLEPVTGVDRRAVEALIEAQEQVFRQALPEFRLIARGAREHPRGGSCPYLELSYEAAPGSTMVQLQIYFVASEPLGGLRLTLSCEARSLARARPAMDAIFESLVPRPLAA
jgi:hypothetical protein